jgi:aspartate carbamoyltransferase catalytic subunit
VGESDAGRRLGLKPSPSGILEYGRRYSFEKLKSFANQSVLSAEQFTLGSLLALYRLAALLQLRSLPVLNLLEDKILAAAFFEGSTRTRFSFESAMLRLGGKVMSFASASSMSVAKGEQLCDIGQMFNSYADVVVIRHTEQEALKEMTEYLRIPMINGGNGSDEHPTQALADWYALLKWRPEIGFGSLEGDRKIHIGIVGTPTQMRSVNSFLRLGLNFSASLRKITIVSEMADPLGVYVDEIKSRSSVEVVYCNNLDEVLGDLDVIYINSIAFLGDGYKTLENRYRLENADGLKEGSVILHPLARRDELSKSLDRTPHNLYFNQADGAVFVRQALLLSIFDRVESLSAHSEVHP